MRRLQAAGVPAGAAFGGADVLVDEHLKARGFWQSRERAFVGRSPNPSAPYRFGATPLTVDYDYDTTYDFSKLKTFGWAPSPPGDQMEEFTEKRFQGSLTSQLQAKGYSPSAESPDFLITTEGIKKTVSVSITADQPTKLIQDLMKK